MGFRIEHRDGDQNERRFDGDKRQRTRTASDAFREAKSRRPASGQKNGVGGNPGPVRGPGPAEASRAASVSAGRARPGDVFEGGERVPALGRTPRRADQADPDRMKQRR
jgi:hypothetical protein